MRVQASLAAFGISAMTMWAAQLYAPRYTLQLLTGIAAATVVHFVVGIDVVEARAVGF